MNHTARIAELVIDTREEEFAIEGLGVGVIRGGGPL